MCACVCVGVLRANSETSGMKARPTVRKRAGDLEVAVDAVSYRRPIERNGS